MPGILESLQNYADNLEFDEVLEELIDDKFELSKIDIDEVLNDENTEDTEIDVDEIVDEDVADTDPLEEAVKAAESAGIDGLALEKLTTDEREANYLGRNLAGMRAESIVKAFTKMCKNQLYQSKEARAAIAKMIRGKSKGDKEYVLDTVNGVPVAYLPANKDGSGISLILACPTGAKGSTAETPTVYAYALKAIAKMMTAGKKTAAKSLESFMITMESDDTDLGDMGDVKIDEKEIQKEFDDNLKDFKAEECDDAPETLDAPEEVITGAEEEDEEPVAEPEEVPEDAEEPVPVETEPVTPEDTEEEDDDPVTLDSILDSLF